ncbi:sulfotransferase [Sphingomonas sp. LHG3406-1]|uniref:tetratricopeptide repeat-containing sulfotransferase family protein n=1 Tax=Sphingomonas sp. LHG3406-1 TaxID=2804617 RepID=UPI0026314C99|nr:sulfotransferase [Sphingomonas sp. LHG3406-1]
MNVSASPLMARAEQAFAAGKNDQAAALVAQHLRQRPGDPRGLSLLGSVAAATGALFQAELFFRKALMAAPPNRELRLSLARVLNQQDKLPEALAMFEPLRDGADSSTEVIVSLILDKLGRHDEARAILAAAVERHPERPNVWLTYAHHLRSAGETEAAIDAYRRAIAITPDLGDAWWGLASIKKKVFSPADIEAMEAAVAMAVDVNNSAPLHFALGRAFQAEQQHEQAFRHYEEANAIWARSLDYDSGQLTREVDESRQLFTADFLKRSEGAGDPSDAPIFIVSLPRSGSTLLEQMLGSHPDIEPLGELPHIPSLLRIMMEGATRAGIRSVPEAIAKLSPQDRTGMGQEYLRRVAAHRKTDRPYFVDKMPHNWSNALLLRQILPNARIIDIRRDAMTCCWSNFSHSFSRAHASSFTLEGIGRAYVDYVRLMDHLDDVLPGWIKHVPYDRMIDEPEPVLRGLFEGLGIPFDEAVLRFHEAKRTVRTPSAEQVRRPLNREGVGTWKPYEQWLGPLKDALGPHAH